MFRYVVTVLLCEISQFSELAVWLRTAIADRSFDGRLETIPGSAGDGGNHLRWYTGPTDDRLCQDKRLDVRPGWAGSDQVGYQHRATGHEAGDEGGGGNIFNNIWTFWWCCGGFFQQNPIAWPLSSFCVTWGENLESSITPSWTSVIIGVNVAVVTGVRTPQILYLTCRGPWKRWTPAITATQSRWEGGEGTTKGDDPSIS